MYGESMDGHARGAEVLEGASSVSAAVVRETGPVKPEPRGSLREEQKKLTRNRVLDAAVVVFAEKAFVDTTMEDIAKAAGVSRVTVYAHFPGKGDIMQALARRVYDTMDEVYGGLAQIPQWTRAAIRNWLDDAVERWRAMAPTLRVVHVGGAMAGPHDFMESQNRYVDEHQRYAAELIGDGRRWRGVSPPQAHQRAVMAVLQSESFLTTWIAADLPLATDDPLDLLVDSLCHLLGPALG
jgi:AcrR family transcriptional regulator